MAGTIPKKTGFGSRSRTTDVMAGAVIGGHTIPAALSFTFAQSATQYYSECEIQVLNKDGQLIPGTHELTVYISDNSAGQGLAATAPATSFAMKANSGVVLGSLTANKALRIITLATGKATVVLADDVTPVLLYVAASIPCIGKVQVSRKTVAGDYKP